MANAFDYAYRAVSPALLAAATFTKDVGAGILSTAKVLVTFAGCVSVLAGGVLLGSDEARAYLSARLPGSDSPVIAMQDVGPGESDAEVLAISASDPQQKRIVQYLARRYRVADGAVRMLVANAFQIGKEKSLDPLLILSVVAIESSLNPFAQSAVGAQGLMQVMTQVHAQRFAPHGGEIAALDPIANMKVGSSILHELISRGGSVERGLQLYVGAGNLPDDGGYGARVLGERTRLHLAASGKVDAAIASAIRAAAVAPLPVQESKLQPMPASTEAAPLEPTVALPVPSSTSDAMQVPSRPEQSV